MAIAGDAGRRVVFAADGREFRWIEVIIAAAARGDWALLRRQGAAARPPAPRAALNDWRRKHRLYSADDTTAWLSHWSLDVRDLEEHLGVRPRPAGVDLDRAAWIHAVCTGAHKDLARRLAAQVALAPPRPGARLDVDELERLGRVSTTRKQQIEASDLVDELIARHADDWVRVRMRRLTLDDLDAAREVVLCVRHDGLSLGEVAAVADREVSDRRAFLDELDADWHALVAGAAVGEVRGPVSTEGGHDVLQLLDRSFAADDPAVVARGRAAALERAVAREAPRFVWHERL